MTSISSPDSGSVKVKLVRAWSKLAPKLITFAATGLSASTVIAMADEYLDITLPLGLTGLIVTLVATVAGYFKADSYDSNVLSEADPRERHAA